MLGTMILSVMGGFNTVIDAYKNVGVVINGDGTDRLLDAIRELTEHVVQIKEDIYFAPRWRAVSDIAHPSLAVSDLRSVCQILEPIQQAIGGKIVSSRLINTPDKMEAALKTNPWAVLHNITPFELASQPTNPAMVPIMFAHDGKRYIGWQMRGILPVMFNCEWQDLPGMRESVPVIGPRKVDAIEGGFSGREEDETPEHHRRRDAFRDKIYREMAEVRGRQDRTSTAGSGRREDETQEERARRDALLADIQRQMRERAKEE